MTFAGGFFAEEIEDRVAKMFVVQIEVMQFCIHQTWKR